jgi:hypothetical protein
MNAIRKDFLDNAGKNLPKIKEALEEIQKQENILDSLGFDYKIVFKSKNPDPDRCTSSHI